MSTLHPAEPEKISPGIWASATASMRSKPTELVTAVAAAVTIAMGWADYVTGWEVSLFLFYAVPITLAVWWSGARSGIVIAVLCGVVWWMANVRSHPYETDLGYAWALINREFYFCVVVFAVNAVRNKQDADAARIQMLEERRQLEKDIVSMSEHEQQRIGQDLHDGLCQQLAAIGCAVHALAEDLEAKSLPESRDAGMIEESVRQAVIEARNLARGIFPVHVDRIGLAAALGDLARITGRLTGTEIEVTENAETQIDDPEASMHLYRIAQEAVANAVRHGGARHIRISLNHTPDDLEMRIDDDGCGIKGGGWPQQEGMGLRTMRYRSQAVGASLGISPGPGGGTAVSCKMHLESRTRPSHVQT